MKIKVVSLTQEALRKRDYRDMLAIEVDGKPEFEVWDGEPEDSNLGRDFNACFNVPKLMRMAYEAGKRNETFEVEQIQEDEI